MDAGLFASIKHNQGNVGLVAKGDVLLCKLEGLPDMSIRIV